MLSDPALFRAVSAFLSDPVICLESSERMQELTSELDHLRLEYSKLQLEYDRLKSMYQQEMSVVFRLQDICREHGINWR